jgi:poly(3-hydroxybutyrate) depolymerase
MRIFKFLSIAFIICLILSCNKNNIVPIIDEPDELENIDDVFDQAVNLKEGINNVSITSTGKKRFFKYYMPSNLKETGVSIIFRFHGNATYNPSKPDTPIDYITGEGYFGILADTTNSIIVWPLGDVYNENFFGWNDHETNAVFFDKMVKYFTAGCPALDSNRIFVCGHSSGAIFSYGLAYLRPDVVAAACPVAGQLSFEDKDVPERSCPIRAFNGTNDAIVDFESSQDNINFWAENICNCDMSLTEIINFDMPSPYGKKSTRKGDGGDTGNAGDKDKPTPVTITKFKGGTSDIEFWAIQGAPHSIDWLQICPYIWEFFNSHTLNK